MATGEALALESIVERLTAVEQEVADLKECVRQGRHEEPWYLKHAGKFADDPEFQEIVRLGREIREADMPE